MLDIIIAELLLAILITFFVGKKLAAIIAFFISLLPLVALLDWASMYGFKFISFGIEKSMNIAISGITLHLAITPLSWFFGIMIFSLFPAIMLFSYSFYDKNDGFYPFMLLALFSSFGILLARDMLTLFLFWEMMSWSSFILIYRNKDKEATIIYLVFSTLSAFLIIFGILLLYSQNNSLLFSEINLTPNLETVVAIISMISGFAVKAALMPLHVWAPVVYSKSDEPFVAFLAGGLSKLGYYGMFLFMFSLPGAKIMEEYFSHISPNYILAVIGALSAFIATIIAFMQDDIRKLLAYSSIGQLGYIAVGLGIGSQLAITGALFQAFNHAFFKTVLFLAAGAVAYRTGKWKISELGGVAYKMPITFTIALLSIFTLAAIPITSGFAAKWLLYEAAIKAKYIFVAPIMLIAGVGAFLYSFRILYGVFLGGNNHPDIKEAPKSMLAAMFVLVLPMIIFVIFPGYALDMMSRALSDAGIASIPHTVFTIKTSLASYNAIAVLITLIAALIPAFLIYKSKPHRIVDFKDNYLAGEIPSKYENISMHAAHNFYKPVEDVMKPYFEPGTIEYYKGIYKGLAILSNTLRKVYTGFTQDYAIYVAIFLLTVMGWLIWL